MRQDSLDVIDEQIKFQKKQKLKSNPKKMNSDSGDEIGFKFAEVEESP